MFLIWLENVVCHNNDRAGVKEREGNVVSMHE